jgi:hypothetical protein
LNRLRTIRELVPVYKGNLSAGRHSQITLIIQPSAGHEA